jgi:ElaB/YqjD/DUF883 family membrane-anchored ribosome-binding protein
MEQITERRTAKMAKEEVKSKSAPDILTKPLPQVLDEMECIIESATEAAKRAAEADAKATEALSKAEEALVAAEGKASLSWQMIAVFLLIALCSIFGAVAISIGLGGIG